MDKQTVRVLWISLNVFRKNYNFERGFGYAQASFVCNLLNALLNQKSISLNLGYQNSKITRVAQTCYKVTQKSSKLHK